MTRSALQNAASIAALFLTTEAVIADKPEKAAAAAGRRRAAVTWTSDPRISSSHDRFSAKGRLPSGGRPFCCPQRD